MQIAAHPSEPVLSHSRGSQRVRRFGCMAYARTRSAIISHRTTPEIEMSHQTREMLPGRKPISAASGNPVGFRQPDWISPSNDVGRWYRGGKKDYAVIRKPYRRQGSFNCVWPSVAL